MEIEIIFVEELPSLRKNRISGMTYVDKKGKIVIWNGKRFHCIHNKREERCKECKGSQICEHNTIKQRCKTCKGTEICEHNKRKEICKDCKGGSICEHNKVRTICKQCKGGHLCEHNRIRSQCKKCQGGGICEHNKIRSRCKDCKGGSICSHNRRKEICKECKGSQLCIHKLIKSQCYKCLTHPQNFCSYCKHTYIKNCPYHPYCFACYCHLNPNEKIPRRYMMKENYINNFLKENLDIPFEHNKIIDNGCSKKRPDWFFDCLTHSVIMECDENKHEGYNKECDNKRTMEIFQDLGNRPVVFIRFNPDKTDTIEGCFEFDKKNKIIATNKWDKRKIELLERINYHLENIPEKEITIEYLFYN